jgi:hypothetical protein
VKRLGLLATLYRTVFDRTDQIESDAGVIRLLSERVPVLAFVNNHFDGYAPARCARWRRSCGANQDHLVRPKQGRPAA